MATIVHTADLVNTVIASVIAGVGVTGAFSVAIWGGARYADLSEDGRPLAAGAAAAVGLLALAVTLAAVAVGMAAMLSK